MAKSTALNIKQRPDIQYTLAFFAGLAAFFVAGFVGSLIPFTGLFPPPPFGADATQVLIADVVTFAITMVIPAAVFGAGFWLLSKGLQRLGVKVTSPRMVWRGVAVALVPFIVAVVATTLVSMNFYSDISTNNQVLIGLAFFVATGLCYVAGWWTMRRSSR